MKNEGKTKDKTTIVAMAAAYSAVSMGHLKGPCSNFPSWRLTGTVLGALVYVWESVFAKKNKD